MKMLLRAMPAIVIFISMTSCMPVPVEKPPEMVWPLPPEKPRVKFVELIIGSVDVTGMKDSKLRHLLFGEVKEVSFNKPSYVTVHDGAMYVTDINTIHIFDFKNKKYSSTGQGFLKNATGIGVASDGTIIVGDSGVHNVVLIKPGAPKANLLAPEGVFVSPGGIFVDNPRGRFYVTDAKTHRVSAFGLDGRFLFSIGGRGEAPGLMNYPYDVKADSDGNIYVIDSGNFRVQVFDKDGNFKDLFGAVGAVPGFFSRPKGIALDSDGHLYVLDSAFGNFQIFQQDGTVLLDVGSNGSEPGSFLLPMGIFIDNDDKIYIVDQANKRIQIFQYLKESS